MSYKFLICITAHNPLQRFDPLLAVLDGYWGLPGHKDIYIWIDHDHRQDKETLESLLEPYIDEINLEVVVAPPELTGYTLTWAHKPFLKTAIQSHHYDFYIYTENDMLFRPTHFHYWLKYKDKLKELNLEPGFCRYEALGGLRVPFDNHRRWSLTRATPNVWGEMDFKVRTYLTPHDEFVGFAALGNPYMGMMILDQEMANEYITTNSFDPVKSFEMTKFRCWPIADRSSMGIAFENLLPEQDHRRVVPLVRVGDTIEIAWCGLIEHLDTRYSEEMHLRGEELLDTEEFIVP